MRYRMYPPRPCIVADHTVQGNRSTDRISVGLHPVLDGEGQPRWTIVDVSPTTMMESRNPKRYHKGLFGQVVWGDVGLFLFCGQGAYGEHQHALT